MIPILKKHDEKFFLQKEGALKYFMELEIFSSLEKNQIEKSEKELFPLTAQINFK